MSRIRPSNPPDPTRLLKSAATGSKPLAIVLAGHNGSGKSTFWYDKLADRIQIPLVNADRLTMSILPAPKGDSRTLPVWAARLRDGDPRWQKLSQEGVQLFMGLIMERRMPFAFETVFSYLKKQQDGTYKSKADIILSLQKAGYFVALIFIGLTSAQLSRLRVKTRLQQGGHDVPADKLSERFPRTQRAIQIAAPIADLTLMFDNSRTIARAFTLTRIQKGKKVLYDCREQKSGENSELLSAASPWLDKVAPRQDSRLEVLREGAKQRNRRRLGPPKSGAQFGAQRHSKTL